MVTISQRRHSHLCSRAKIVYTLLALLLSGTNVWLLVLDKSATSLNGAGKLDGRIIIMKLDFSFGMILRVRYSPADLVAEV